MPKFYFTFGSGQKYAGKYVVFENTTPTKARQKMVGLFGIKWSMMYDEVEFKGQPTKFGYKKMPGRMLQRIKEQFPCPECQEDLRKNLKSVESVVTRFGWKVDKEGVAEPDGSEKFVDSEISHFECGCCDTMLSEDELHKIGITFY